MEKRLRSGELPAVTVAATPTPTSQNFDETRIQFRSMSGGAPLTHTFRADDTLQSVFDFLRGQQLVVGALATTFPRKEYAASASEETRKTLKELGMVPSVVLLMK